MVKLEHTEDVINALRNKYDDGGSSYAFLEQVGNATGWACNRHADAIAVALWKSRGLSITGFEVKVSRTDWLKELKNPGKAEPIAQYCHQWYLVVGDADIVQFGELPMNWGLMIPHTKTSLKVTKTAVVNEKPKPVDMDFLCGILRQATTQITEKSKLKAQYTRGHDEGYASGKETIEDRLKWEKERTEGWEKKVEEFEKAAGFKITEAWKQPIEVGDAVKMVLNGSYLKELKCLERLHERAVDIANSIKNEVDKHKEKDIDWSVRSQIKMDKIK